ncbi:hypothetical protein INT43_006008 [Umbelopsis isabellina]|uniref:CCHC-type domain-containing protein n=1 Tax=Mortierella isabellina TaxID=91625 RepID=A0A8H7PKL7_MORIS|nr:hypothetical protein INT43_006008 [Umbelopsis isabellina]
MYPRRTCFKCGNGKWTIQHNTETLSFIINLAGHFAESCPEPEKLCYNCKKPGHQSTDCTEPKSVQSKQCYTCGGVGHIQADCPSVGRIPAPNAGTGRCFTCGRFGHIARNCNQTGENGTNSYPRNTRYQNGVTGGSNFRVICYKCGGRCYNHFAKDCQANGVKCYNCGKFGHIVSEASDARSCNNVSGGEQNSRTCYKCGTKGHIARDCPENNATIIETYD